jgi:hypothetical protein
MKAVLFLLVALFLAAQAWIRLAPLPAPGPGTWGPYPQWEGDPGGFGLSVQATPAQAAALDAIIRATPRTRLLSGALAEGQLRYVTRSLVWGFPDITELTVRAQEISISGHLVFGRSDFGVNRRRIQGWLAAAGL